MAVTPSDLAKGHLHKPTVSKQSITNLCAAAFICYTVLIVVHMHTQECDTPPPPPLSNPTISLKNTSNPIPDSNTVQPPPPPQHIPHQTHLPLHRAASVARRKRPQPACASSRQRAKTFLIVFMGHSGSSAIISELRSHSKVVVESPEPVDHQPVHNTTAALEIARQIFDRGIAKGLTPGFKIRPVHILSEPEKWRALAEEYQTRIIWQHRLNTMKAAIGEYSYRYLNDTSSVEGLRVNMTRAERCNVGAGCSFEIHDFSYLHETLKGLIASKNNIVRAVKTISGGGSCIREIPYEDYLYDRENTIHDLLRFLGLPKEKTEPNRYKATGDSMCEVVRNWSDLCANFYSCVTWQPMLDDPHNDCYCPLSTVTAKFCDIRKE